MTKQDFRNVSSNGMAVINGSSHNKEHQRAENDLYCTNPKCVEDLLRVEAFPENIWEPAVGLGSISNVLKQHGHNVRESDIIDRIGNEIHDFLFIPEPDSWNGAIISNPPYSFAQEFVENALTTVTTGNKVAMFLKLTFLEGQKRRKLFTITPPQFVYVYSERQKCGFAGNFEHIKSSAVAYAWFVWTKGFSGEPIIRWL